MKFLEDCVPLGVQVSILIADQLQVTAVSLTARKLKSADCGKAQRSALKVAVAMKANA